MWVAEVMLQQTRASTVAPYYERFLARFPTLEKLADAPLDDVLYLWSGLGYYARARNLHRAAQAVRCRRHGAFPQSEAEIRALPGIGRSTAAAIVAQAYGRRAAILDGNVKRVLARHFRVRGPVSAGATLRELWALAERCTPAKRAADYAQGMMDLGATVCARARPQCPACPLRGTCLARRYGDAERLPQRAARGPRRLERRRFFVLATKAGACFVERRPAKGIWGGLWSPPERSAEMSVSAFLQGAGLEAVSVARACSAPAFRHAFTHYDLDVAPVYIHLNARRPPSIHLPGRWIRPRRHGLGLSAVAARLLAASQQELRLEP